ncbi:MAG TPA: hypothetical protein VH599_05160 [Ktedonobacterales bacterium]|jgi:hypothetical protein
MACEVGATSKKWCASVGQVSDKADPFASVVYRSVVRDKKSKLHVDEQGGMMARKDLEKETERPRYYSQFWLDVAAGRRVIGGGKGAQEGEEAEESEAESASEMSAKAGKAPKGPATPPVVEAEPASRRASAPPLRLSGAESLADLAAAAGLIDMESSEGSSRLEEEDVIEDLEPLPEAEEANLQAEPEEESYSYDSLYDEEDEEEEEGDGWSSSRRGKKHKKTEKPRRREKGRDF